MTRGQHIGEVGDTGDSPLVHLLSRSPMGLMRWPPAAFPFASRDLADDDADLGRYVAPK
jgi:hypothetical protein